MLYLNGYHRTNSNQNIISFPVSKLQILKGPSVLGVKRMDEKCSVHLSNKSQKQIVDEFYQKVGDKANIEWSCD